MAALVPPFDACASDVSEGLSDSGNNRTGSIAGPNSADPAAAGAEAAARPNHRWTTFEHQLLEDLVAQYGQTAGKWHLIASKIPGRTSKQCRERWFSHTTKPKDCKRGGWTAPEEAIIARGHASWGPCWVRISKQLPGRCDNSVKNHFHASMRRSAGDQPERHSIMGNYTNSLKAGLTPMDAFCAAVRHWARLAKPEDVQGLGAEILSAAGMDVSSLNSTQQGAPGNGMTPSMAPASPKIQAAKGPESTNDDLDAALALSELRASPVASPPPLHGWKKRQHELVQSQEDSEQRHKKQSPVPQQQQQQVPQLIQPLEQKLAALLTPMAMMAKAPPAHLVERTMPRLSNGSSTSSTICHSNGMMAGMGVLAEEMPKSRLHQLLMQAAASQGANIQLQQQQQQQGQQQQQQQVQLLEQLRYCQEVAAQQAQMADPAAAPQQQVLMAAPADTPGLRLFKRCSSSGSAQQGAVQQHVPVMSQAPAMPTASTPIVLQAVSQQMFAGNNNSNPLVIMVPQQQLQQLQMQQQQQQRVSTFVTPAPAPAQPVVSQNTWQGLMQQLQQQQQQLLEQQQALQAQIATPTLPAAPTQQAAPQQQVQYVVMAPPGAAHMQLQLVANQVVPMQDVGANQLVSVQNLTQLQQLLQQQQASLLDQPNNKRQLLQSQLKRLNQVYGSS